MTVNRAILFSGVLLCVCGSILLMFNARRYIYKDLQSIAAQKSDNIQLNMDMVDGIIRNIAFNTELQKLLIQYERGEFSTITEAKIRINEAVSNLSLFFSQAENVLVYTADGTIIGNKYEAGGEDPSMIEKLDALNGNWQGNTLWMTDAGRLVNQGGQTAYVCTVATKIRARSTQGSTQLGDLLGYLIVHFSFQDVGKLMLAEQREFETYLTDAEGHILSSNRSGAVGEEADVLSSLVPGTVATLSYNNTHMVAASAKLNIKNADWQCVCMVPVSYIFSDAQTLILLTTLLTGLILTSTFFIIQRKAAGISAVFDKMNASFKSMERGRWDIGAFSKTDIQEVDHTIERFSEMVAKMDHLMYELYEAELRKQQLLTNYKEAELLNLKIQINPHFLYNTLDTINWTARMHDDEDIAEMVLVLGKLFRANMDLSTADASIAQEVERVELFMQLEQKRFGEKLRYTVEVEDTLWDEKIPALMLQPLFENAIKHGVAPYGSEGLISLTIRRREDLIVISVSDSGHGMSADMLEALTRMWDDIANDPMCVREDARCVGLRNIMKRLSLLYGKRASFVIESGEGRTRILIGFPTK